MHAAAPPRAEGRLRVVESSRSCQVSRGAAYNSQHARGVLYNPVARTLRARAAHPPTALMQGNASRQYTRADRVRGAVVHTVSRCLHAWRSVCRADRAAHACYMPCDYALELVSKTRGDWGESRVCLGGRNGMGSRYPHRPRVRVSGLPYHGVIRECPQSTCEYVLCALGRSWWWARAPAVC